MQRHIPLALTLLLQLLATSPAWSQADAQKAYQEAKTAYQAGKYAEALVLAQKAAETDPKNAEVTLLVGQAHYQLGQLDDAIAAWKQTLAAAPEQPYAKKMLDVLAAQRTDVETRTKLVEQLIAQRLYAEAATEAGRVSANKSLNDTQRAKLLLLQAEARLDLNAANETLMLVQQAQTLYPTQVNAVQATLLTGQAKLRQGRDAEGLVMLAKLAKENPGTPAAATAQFEVIAYQLRQNVEAPRTEAILQWIVANPNHDHAIDALKVLADACLDLGAQQSRPGPAVDLNTWDQRAIVTTVELCKRTPRAEEIRDLVSNLLKKLTARYAQAGAHAAMVKATEALLAAPLPSAPRRAVLEAQADARARLALRLLDDMARTGELPAEAKVGVRPRMLADAVEVYAAINREFPAEPAWSSQVQLASQVRAYRDKVLASGPAKQLRGPDAWAIDLVLPVIKAGANPLAVAEAVQVFEASTKPYEDGPPVTRDLAVDASRMLVDALSPRHPAWAKAMLRHATLLDGYARAAFEENVRQGKDADNAKLADAQFEMLQTLTKLVTHEVVQSATARELLGRHLQPWIARGNWGVADEAYGQLAKALPQRERLYADLVLARLWLKRVTGEHARLAQAGLTVPRQLDPLDAKLLVRLYELQGGLDEKDPDLRAIRDIADAVVTHYRALGYDDVAEAAIKTKADKPVEPAEAYAAFQLVRLKDELARRDFARSLREYGASEKIALTPEFAAVIAGYTKFITDRPTSPLVPQTVERIFGIGRILEQQGAFAVAAGVYADLAKFAAGVKVLSQATPEAASVAQRASFTAATALDSQARKALEKSREHRKADDPPPAKLSAEFTASIAAYKAFIEANPESVLVGDAVRQIMAVATEYAKVDAWDVADAVYGDLLHSKLKIQHPERLEFARGVCQLGRAMPDHAREVLAALSTTGLRGPREAGGETVLAMDDFSGVGVNSDAGLTAGGRAPSGSTTISAGTLSLRSGIVNGPPAPPSITANGRVQFSGPATAAPAATPAPATEKAADELSPRSDRDAQLLAMIQRQESSRAAQVAQLRENIAQQPMAQAEQSQQGQQAVRQRAVAVPVVSDAELARQEKALAAAYEAFAAIRKNYVHKPTAQQARAETLVMVGHWRSLSQWQRSAALAERFLADNPTDQQLPVLRLEIARDRLTWAATPIAKKMTRQAMLAEVAARFEAARKELAEVAASFPKEPTYQRDAQWDLANSYLTQARAVAAVSATLARGQFVRAARELQQVAERHADHPRIGEISQMLWSIAEELAGRGFDEEAIMVWNDLRIHDPLNALTQQAALRVAQAYQQKLKLPLRAAEAYQELNFARGGNDTGVQDAIFQIGSTLKNEKRWIEALHVLETFVNSFPRHAQAGQALTMVGQVHQTNEAWKEAIAAYRRVIAEYKEGQWVQEAKWSIAECTINLSQWREAESAYRDYATTYPQDGKVAEANRRIDVLKDLARYQGLIDEKGQRKAFDAQFQIATIVRNQLSNPVKAIIEYRKVVTNWPESYVAANALYEIGTSYLALGETAKAREALLAVGKDYATSPLAGAAVFMVGKSFEDEADRLASVTREKSAEQARDQAQRKAYQDVQVLQGANTFTGATKISGLKKAGKGKAAELEEASQSFNYGQFTIANTEVFAQKAQQDVESLTATQLADRQDKINAALRKAIDAYSTASKIPGGTKADAALLQMANIYDQRLKDSKAAMETWLEIVRQFSGTAVAEDASWKLAQFYEREAKYAQAIEAYNAFLRNYRRSPNAGAAQFAVAECYEHLGQWVAAMDSYNNYLNNFADGPLAAKAKEQINWIKTYRL